MDDEGGAAGLPRLPRLRIGFIGAGRLARALSLALVRAGVPVARVASRRMDSAVRMAVALDGCRAVPAQAVADDCDLIFITTADGALQSVTDSLQWRAGQAVVHCSGATPLTALAAARAAGAGVGGFHPMQAFGSDVEAALASLPGCTIGIEADAPLAGLLRELAARLACRSLDLPPEARARYHAAGGYASQHVHALLFDAVRLWQSWGATEQQALDALLPLLRGTLAALAHGGLVGGMAGPVSRGDAGTVRQHLHALMALDPDMGDLYVGLCRRELQLMREGRRLDAQAADAVAQALQTSGN